MNLIEFQVNSFKLTGIALFETLLYRIYRSNLLIKDSLIVTYQAMPNQPEIISLYLDACPRTNSTNNLNGRPVLPLASAVEAVPATSKCAHL